ncbi:MAG: hypothetical protein ACI81R_003841, partial [Bradymonadia bacterium]
MPPNDVTLGLALVKHGDVLHVLSSSGMRWGSLRPTGTFTPDWAAVHSASRALADNARGASTEGELSATMLAANERLGGFLFDELLPYDVKTALRRD